MKNDLSSPFKQLHDLDQAMGPWLRALYFVLAIRIYFFLIPGVQQMRAKPPFDPLWPLRLLDFLPHPLIVNLFSWGLLVICISCGVFPWSWVLRWMCFFGLFVGVAVQSSHGKVIHGYHAWIYVLFTLLFLPKFSSKIKVRFQMALVVTCAQFAAVTPYMMAGLWKLRNGLVCFSEEGWICVSNSFTNALGAEFSSHGHQLSAVSEFLIQHQWFTGIAFLGLVCLQIFSGAIVFMPRLHVIFGMGIVVFHVLSDWILNIIFYHQMLLIVVLFVFSPLHNGRWLQRIATWKLRQA